MARRWCRGSMRLLFRHENLHRVLLNIGGMANLSYVPPQGEIIAFDTGPGNVLIDEAIRILTNGKKTFDENGTFAQSGQINEQLLQNWLTHPYFQKAPPKSTGRELFGPREAQNMIDEGRALRLSDADIIATLTTLTARTITDARYDFLPRVDEIFVGGGGAKNSFLMAQIAEGFSGTVRAPMNWVCRPMPKKPSPLRQWDLLRCTAGLVICHRPRARRQAAVLGSITPGDNFQNLMRNVTAPAFCGALAFDIETNRVAPIKLTSYDRT